MDELAAIEFFKLDIALLRHELEDSKGIHYMISALKDRLDAEELAMTALQEKIEREKSNGWIGCSERFPDDDKLYLGVSKDGKYHGYRLVHMHEGKLWSSVCGEVECMAWMPLPKPPKEDINGSEKNRGNSSKI